MIQLIIEGTEYPETSHDKYKCYKKDLGEDMRMISGRLVTEVRCKITIIEYAYDYFKDPLMRQCLKDLRANKSVHASYMDPESGTMRNGEFRCTKQPAPTFAFSVDGRARWHNISFTLESVEGE